MTYMQIPWRPRTAHTALPPCQVWSQKRKVASHTKGGINNWWAIRRLPGSVGSYEFEMEESWDDELYILYFILYIVFAVGALGRLAMLGVELFVSAEENVPI